MHSNRPSALRRRILTAGALAKRDDFEKVRAELGIE